MPSHIGVQDVPSNEMAWGPWWRDCSKNKCRNDPGNGQEIRSLAGIVLPGGSIRASVNSVGGMTSVAPGRSD